VFTISSPVGATVRCMGLSLGGVLQHKLETVVGRRRGRKASYGRVGRGKTSGEWINKFNVTTIVLLTTNTTSQRY